MIQHAYKLVIPKLDVPAVWPESAHDVLPLSLLKGPGLGGPAAWPDRPGLGVPAAWPVGPGLTPKPISEPDAPAAWPSVPGQDSELGVSAAWPARPGQTP